MTETQTPSVQQKPCIPTISHMKKPPVRGGLAGELGCCRGTYPPPAAGCMVTAFAPYQKEHRRFADALDDIILPHLFGSKVQFSNQAKIFCYLPDKIPMPLLCRPLRYAEL